MACSKYEYTKKYELPHALIPLHTFPIVRVDGHAFSRFTALAQFKKPLDSRGLELANAVAMQIMDRFPGEIVMAFGQSDEYSFVWRRETTVWGRRREKMATIISGLFSAIYVSLFPLYFPGTSLPLVHENSTCTALSDNKTNNHSSTTNILSSSSSSSPPPAAAAAVGLDGIPYFDAKVIAYPTRSKVKDYLKWRQADCHVNNLYNTAFWALVKDPKNAKTERQAQAILKDTDAAAKNELLYTQYGINYNALPEMYRKGTILYRERQLVTMTRTRRRRLGKDIVKRHDSDGSDGKVGDETADKKYNVDETVQEEELSSFKVHDKDKDDDDDNEQDVEEFQVTREKRVIVQTHCDLISTQAEFWEKHQDELLGSASEE